jgi:hypothetical protein
MGSAASSGPDKQAFLSAVSDLRKYQPGTPEYSRALSIINATDNKTAHGSTVIRRVI